MSYRSFRYDDRLVPMIRVCERKFDSGSWFARVCDGREGADPAVLHVGGVVIVAKVF